MDCSWRVGKAAAAALIGIGVRGMYEDVQILVGSTSVGMEAVA